jgi:hypothetical protein
VRRFVVSMVGGATGVFLGLAGPAMAQGGGERVGENIGDLLGGWAESLFLGIAGLVALLFLLNAGSGTWRSSCWPRRWWAAS